jgi:hypothetical protein
MSGGRQTNRHLDELIDEITVDCYDEDEQLQGFENAFDEDASFPVSGTLSVNASTSCTSDRATAAAN